MPPVPATRFSHTLNRHRARAVAVAAIAAGPCMAAALCLGLRQSAEISPLRSTTSCAQAALGELGLADYGEAQRQRCGVTTPQHLRALPKAQMLSLHNIMKLGHRNRLLDWESSAAAAATRAFVLAVLGGRAPRGPGRAARALEAWRRDGGAALLRGNHAHGAPPARPRVRAAVLRARRRLRGLRLGLKPPPTPSVVFARRFGRAARLSRGAVPDDDPTPGAARTSSH